MRYCERRGLSLRQSLLPRRCQARLRSLRTPVHGDEIDAALQAKVAAREITGVVAMAANENSIFYQGAFGPRSWRRAVPMSTDTIFRVLPRWSNY